MLEAQAARLLLGESGVIRTQTGWNGRLVFAELLADIFETGERLHAAEAEFFGNRLLKIGGDECLDDHATRAVGVIEDSEFKKPCRPIPSEDRADLVAGDEMHFPFRIPRGNTHAVVIRVGGDDEVRAGAVSLRDGHRERLGIFRIWRLHRREASIGNFLLGHAVALKSQPLQHGFDDDRANAVQRGVDDLEGVLAADQLRIDRESGQPLHVGLVDVHAHRNDASTLALRHRREAFGLHGIDAVDDRRGVRLGDLTAVFEVNFVAVVFRRIVARSEVDASLGLHVADGKGQLRRGTGSLEKVGVAAQIGDDFCSQLRELARKKPRVMAKTNGRFSRAAALGEILLHIVHKPLSRAADVVGVHRIRAHAGELWTPERLRISLLDRGHHCTNRLAAQPARSKRQRAKKAVVQLTPIAGSHQLCHRGLINRRGTFRKQALHVFCRLGKKFPISSSLADRGKESVHAGRFSTVPRRL